MIKRIIDKIIGYTCRYSNNSFIKYLRNKGIAIGEGNKFRPFSTKIDLTRPSLVTIGNNCYFNENFCLLTHDWVTHVFINSGREFLPSSGRVTIGNNVSTGQNVTILKGVTIGDNVFIGANSVVTKDIPSNSIAVGIPCKVVMSLDDYYHRRKQDCVREALDYALSIQQRFNRMPIEADFWEEFPLFIDGNKIDEYPELAETVKRQLGSIYNEYVKGHRAIYSSFKTFLEAAGINDEG